MEVAVNITIINEFARGAGIVAGAVGGGYLGLLFITSIDNSVVKDMAEEKKIEEQAAKLAHERITHLGSGIHLCQKL
jgi:hypothetical protein